jgi:hypothetical protein
MAEGLPLALGGIIFWVRMREKGIEIKVSDGKNAE